MSDSRPWRLAAIVALVIISSAAAAEARTFYVANDGTDSGGCGAAKNPCRSLSQAITNASARDAVSVGPGRYGDLNGNGTLGETGEETAPGGCSCMISVDKELTIVSRDGAFTTVLDAGGASLNVVRIAASGVVFGRQKHGFTLTGGGLAGLEVTAAGTGIRIAGNLAVANASEGFTVASAGNTINGNVAVANGARGFVLGDDQTIVTGNVALANGSHGFDLLDGTSLLRGNVASANGEDGFRVAGTANVLRNNVTSANGAHGVDVEAGTGHELTHNAVVGNSQFGIDVVTGATASVTTSSIFGNNAEMTSSLTNCGLHNASGATIVATPNYWGANSGPGADPADDVCDVSGTTTVDPFARSEIRVNAQTTPIMP
jgi:hypothetical protein